MRKAIHDYLKAHCQSITEWVQPYMATKDTPKPFGVIILGEEIRSPVNRQGSFREFYIWPYVADVNYLELDAAVAEIRRLLTGKVLTTDSGSRFVVEFVGEQRDFRDDDLEALTRRIDFQIPQTIRG